YLDGKGFFLVSLLRELGTPTPSGGSFAIVAAVVLAALTLHVAFRAKSRDADPAIFLPLAVTAVVLVSPHYPWYFAFLLPLLTRAPYASLIYLTLAAFIPYLPPIKDFDDYLTAGMWIYVICLVIALAGRLARYPPPPIESPA